MPDIAFTCASEFEKKASSTLNFYLNGTRISLDGNTIDPDATLLDFIRSQGQGFTGTKLGCGEGGCGACTVVVQSKSIDGRLEHLAVNACLAPIVSVDGKHVITVEGLGNSDNPHPLQERLWKMSGSQCGFCTPGIVMSLYAVLRNATSKGSLTVEDVELEGALDGNLCRCTGYKPILDAAKTFVGDYMKGLQKGSGSEADRDFIVPVNLEAANLDEARDIKIPYKAPCCDSNSVELSTDISMPVESSLETKSPPIDEVAGAMGRTAPAPSALTSNSKSNGTADDHMITKPKANGCGRSDCCQLNGGDKSTASTPAKVFPRFEFKPYRPGTELIFPPGLAKYEILPLKFGNEHRVWARPTSLVELLQLKKDFPEAKLVGGSSEIQIEVHLKAAKYPLSIFIADIPELYTVTMPSASKPVFEFGANLPLAKLEQLCKVICADLDPKLAGPVLAIQSQLRYFAGLQIRNVASVGGNIATASPISDLNPVWVAIGAKLIALSQDKGEIEMDMDAFFVGYRKTALALHPDAIIYKIVVPLNQSEDQEVVKAYKQAKRRDDDIAIVTACFCMRVSKAGTITHAKIAFGGMAAWTTACPKTAECLVGKPVSSATLDEGLIVLGQEVDLSFNVPGGMPSYRKTLALSFFFKFFTAASVDLDMPLDESISKTEIEDITTLIHRQASTGRRDNSDPFAQEVVGKQAPHLSGLKHVTGEAVYVDDMPKIGNEGYGALVLSQKAHAKILSVDPSPALEMEGVIAWVDHNDLPNERANYWGTAALDEVFFAVDEVVSHGHPIGMVVAKDKITAQKAARQVIVMYEALPMILTIEEAVEANSFHPQYNRRISRGKDTATALAESEYVLEGSTRMGGQEHFYLETMAALVVPKLEGGEMEVFSSTQALTDTQRWVAQVTGVPRNRIVARSKRLGGGFGGKETRSSLLTAIVAVAAKKTRRPVRAMLDRSEDIITTGQRHPCLAKWKVGFTKEGKLEALDVDFYSNAGYSLDISGGVVDRALAHLDNSYWIPNVDVRGRCCKTNTVSNTAFRGFGGPQGMYVAEHYLEAIADKLKLDIDHVREINLYKEGEKTPYHQKVLDWHVPRLLEDCKSSSNYVQRRVEVDAFNKDHKWRKRGICLLPTKFGLAFGVKAMNQGSALVHIYMDGSVLIAHGGTEMGQGLYTKCQQIAAQELKVTLDQVFTSESATNTVPNAVPTAGSAGSDLNGYAIHNACAELNKRLEPYQQKLGPDATLASMAGAAWGDRISLSATGHHATPNLGYEWNNQSESGNLFHYFTQGVAATEVEVDILTGDHTVLRVDINMDVGKSLNPAIDYGQIEGAFVQGQGWCTLEESLWLRHNGAIFTQGPGAYKIPGFSDIPQVFNVSLLRDAEWPNLGSIKASKGIGEPPFFLGCSVALAIRYALKSARADAGIEELQDFALPATSERIRLAAGDFLANMGHVDPKEGQKDFFVRI